MLSFFKRISSLALCAIFLIGACGCSYISADHGEDDDTDDPPTVIREEVGDDGWKYTFGREFIEENGISYVWNEISEDARANLGQAMNAIREMQTYCPLTVGLSKEEFDDFLQLLSNCITAYPYVNTTFTMHIDDTGTVKGLTIKYLVSEEEKEDLRTKMELRLDEILSGCPEGSEFEKIRYLHDRLILSCEYDDTAPNAFNAYGALIEGKAACQGYADSLCLLLSRAGFETGFAVGEDQNTGARHKWCYVRLSDGGWYLIDPTWDDPGSVDVMYDFFLISDEVYFKKGAKKVELKYLHSPVAKSMDMNFHKVMGYVAYDEESAVSVLRKQAIEAAKTGGKYLYLRFEDAEKLQNVYEEISSGYSGSNRMQNILIEADEESGGRIKTATWSQVLDADLGTLTIIINYKD